MRTIDLSNAPDLDFEGRYPEDVLGSRLESLFFDDPMVSLLSASARCRLAESLSNYLVNERRPENYSQSASYAQDFTLESPYNCFGHTFASRVASLVQRATHPQTLRGL